jgi:hypothetical protein
MRRSFRPFAVAVLVFAPSIAFAQDAPKRSASVILADYDGVSYPSMSDGSDPESIARFSKAIEDAAHRQEACALELLESHPKHERVPELLKMRWQLLVNVDHDFTRVRRETERFVGDDGGDASGAKRRDARLVPLAHVARAWACVEDESLPAATRVADLERAVRVAPEDFLARVALLDYAKTKCCDPAFQREVATRVAKLDAASHAEGDDARKLLKLLDRVGQAWPGTALDVGALHGHPVVVSFFPSPWSDREPREAAALVALAKEFGSDDGGLEFVVVHTLYSQDDEADRRKHVDALRLPGRCVFETRDVSPGVMERTLGAEIPNFVLLLDRDGRLVALSGEAKSLRPALAKLFEAKGKRRPI